MSSSSSPNPPASRLHWWFVVFSGLATVLFGSIGVWQYESSHSAHGHDLAPRLLSSVYTSMQMLILHTPHFEHGTNLMMEIGRWMGVITVGTTTVFVFYTRVRRELRWILHRRAQGHTVVCGLGERGMGIVRHLRAEHQKRPVVAIDSKQDPKRAAECDRLGVCLLEADATDPTVLAAARVTRASDVIVVTSTDEINVRVGLAVQALSAAGTFSPPTCHVHLADVHLRDVLQRQRHSGPAENQRAAPHFFDVFAHEARQTLSALPIDGAGIAATEPTAVHVVIMGFGRMGRSVALCAAKLGHFANGRPLRITIIDRQAATHQESLLFRFPALASNLICNLQFIAAEAESLTTRRLLEQFAAEAETVLHVFICTDENTRAMELAMRTREILTRRKSSNLIVRLKSKQTLDSIAPPSAEMWPRVRDFGSMANACDASAYCNDLYDKDAQSHHEDFAARLPSGIPPVLAEAGALRPWLDLPEEFRDSHRQQVDHLPIKLRAIGRGTPRAMLSDDAVTAFGADEIEILAQMEHRRWCAERMLAGWRKGDTACASRRSLPQLVNWDQLEEPMRDYHRTVIRSIPGFCSRTEAAEKIAQER